MLPLRILALGAAIGSSTLATSCASSRAGGDESRPSRPQRRNSALITREELAASAASDLYAAVQRLRPDWLVSRGSASLTREAEPLLVYIDGQRVGTRSILTSIPISGVRELRYYDTTDATQRWGTGHTGGVIEIISG